MAEASHLRIPRASLPPRQPWLLPHFSRLTLAIRMSASTHPPQAAWSRCNSASPHPPAPASPPASCPLVPAAHTGVPATRSAGNAAAAAPWAAEPPGQHAWQRPCPPSSRLSCRCRCHHHWQGPLPHPMAAPLERLRRPERRLAAFAGRPRRVLGWRRNPRQRVQAPSHCQSLHKTKGLSELRQSPLLVDYYILSNCVLD